MDALTNFKQLLQQLSSLRLNFCFIKTADFQYNVLKSTVKQSNFYARFPEFRQRLRAEIKIEMPIKVSWDIGIENQYQLFIHHIFVSRKCPPSLTQKKNNAMITFNDYLFQIIKETLTENLAETRIQTGASIVTLIPYGPHAPATPIPYGGTIWPPV